ncbi:hypothetical protein AVEN_155081-1 [Araneus ventricosus]|uniref:Uncharacterized protein n=1 Tax=Araneus ventricosus TaxID=182803 RepID=A0A4Y2A8B0_ARAVE|nr:hypothetical protein AVEN_155081-1 [Araneus ventricosus]
MLRKASEFSSSYHSAEVAAANNRAAPEFFFLLLLHVKSLLLQVTLIYFVVAEVQCESSWPPIGNRRSTTHVIITLNVARSELDEKHRGNYSCHESRTVLPSVG